MRRRSAMLAILLVALLCCPFFFVAEAETASSDSPESLAKKCVYNGTRRASSLKSLLGDRDYDTRVKLEAGDWVCVLWTEAQPVDFVYYEWTDKLGISAPQHTVELLDADGAVLALHEGKPYWNCGLAPESGVYGVRLTLSESGELCSLIPYAGGAPADYHPWEPTPEKLDFLVIATHPDDDTLFMGGMIPTYGAERGLTGSILYLTTRVRVRRSEALNGAWIMGLRTYPLMAGLQDVSIKNREKYKDKFLPEDVERTLVQYLRQYRPEVIMTHDVNGEYGHWQHVLVSEAIQKAVRDAADPAYDPSSADRFGVWQVKKLYLHLYAENPIFISATVPLDAFAGRSAWEVAQEAYQCHKSQRLWYHLCNNKDENSLERFGLAFTTVGLDSGINDMFENIDPAVLSDFVPTPAPTEVPTPGPTDTPAPAALSSASPAPTREPVFSVHAATEAPSSPPPSTPPGQPVEAFALRNGMLLPIALSVVLLTALGILLLSRLLRIPPSKK